MSKSCLKGKVFPNTHFNWKHVHRSSFLLNIYWKVHLNQIFLEEIYFRWNICHKNIWQHFLSKISLRETFIGNLTWMKKFISIEYKVIKSFIWMKHFFDFLKNKFEWYISQKNCLNQLFPKRIIWEIKSQKIRPNKILSIKHIWFKKPYKTSSEWNIGQNAFF